MIKHLRLATLSRRDQVLVKNFEDIFANLGKLCFDLLAVFLDERNLRFISFGFLLLLNRCYDSPRGTASANDILVSNREEISLFN